jgi:alkylation response protein AidB-like acyl-CoA dehydrogenase
MALYYGDTWIVTKFPDAAQAEAFSNGTGRISGATTLTGTLEPCAGGFLLNGRWGFHSGCPGADWSIACARLHRADGGEDDPRFALVPMRDMTILPDWDVFGMAGTGSNTVTATDVFVPEHRTLAIPRIDGSIQIGAVGVVLGMARAAIELFLESLPGRAITYTHYGERREAPITHIMLAEAQLRVDGASALVSGMIERIEASDRSGERLSDEDRAIVLAHKAQCFRLAREAVEIIYSQSGASAISRSAPIQRIFRDIEAICQHAMHQIHTNLERYGQHLVGLEGWVFGR